MRISDWSSDVCSSDLLAAAPATDFLVLPDHHRIATQCFVGGEIAAEKSARRQPPTRRSEEHTSELQSLMRISYAVFCLKKKSYSYSTPPLDLQYSHTSPD